MMNSFFQFSTRVDYGEMELCGEQALLHVSEYQEYLSSDAPFFPNLNQDLLADPLSAK